MLKAVLVKTTKVTMLTGELRRLYFQYEAFGKQDDLQTRGTGDGRLQQLPEASGFEERIDGLGHKK
eukprot:scaffold15898_cov64-Cylindrotheca_fusiformis.AAC.1